MTSSAGRYLRTLTLAASLLAITALATESTAEAGRKRSSHATRGLHGINDKGSTRVCSTSKGKKKRCRREKVFQGHGVASDELRTEPLERPSGALDVHAENLSEDVQVKLYKEDGTFDEASLAALDEIFRCKRTDETRAVRPELYETLSRIYDHFGQRRITLISGFRFAERDSSRHFHASAMDIKIDGVPPRQVYDFARSLDGGGMGIGIYPHSGFVHVDFRAPGDPSYRWVDLSGPSQRSRKSKPTTHRTTRATKPVS
jgi:uncharacterized protein YcbK (DUF882 family)